MLTSGACNAQEAKQRRESAKKYVTAYINSTVYGEGNSRAMKSPFPLVKTLKNMQGMLRLANSLLSVFSLLTTKGEKKTKKTTKSELSVNLQFAIHLSPL